MQLFVMMETQMDRGAMRIIVGYPDLQPRALLANW